LDADCWGPVTVRLANPRSLALRLLQCHLGQSHVEVACFVSLREEQGPGHDVAVHLPARTRRGGPLCISISPARRERALKPPVVAAEMGNRLLINAERHGMGSWLCKYRVWSPRAVPDLLSVFADRKFWCWSRSGVGPTRDEGQVAAPEKAEPQAISDLRPASAAGPKPQSLWSNFGLSAADGFWSLIPAELFGPATLS